MCAQFVDIRLHKRSFSTKLAIATVSADHNHIVLEYGAKLGRYEVAAQRYGRWTSEGLLAPAQLSAVLASYAEDLMMAKLWAGDR